MRRSAAVSAMLRTMKPRRERRSDPATRDQASKRQTLNIRIKAEERGLIDRAARASGKTRTDFILDAARRAAETTLLEQALIRVGPEAFDAFFARLDAPPQPNEWLRKTMRTTPPWEKA